MNDKCLICQAAGPGKPPAPLKPSELPPSAWHTLKADFRGPIPGTHQPQCLLVTIECYSRFTEVEIVSSTSANAVIPKLDRILATHGIPVKIKTDNGPRFQNEEIDRYIKILGIRHKRITSLWPPGNAEAESFMRPLKKLLQTCSVEKKNWRAQLQHFLLNYHATPHCVTGEPPAELLFHRSICTKLPELASTCDLVNKHPIAKENDNQTKLKAKEYSDTRKHAVEREIKIGDIVLVKQEKKNKLTTRFDPTPFHVTFIKGTKITAENNFFRSITRNISFFKKLNAAPIIDHDDGSDFDDDKTPNSTDKEEQSVILPRRYPLREKSLLHFYGTVFTHGR